ncbi:hypothetical protein BFP70_17400 [Thioclava sp. SK-1]|uniref:plasmid replication protein RepC n=1 Tax=Thioclava sp. SK-1 TaxID=1889770 RepID=UPI000825F38D|nr:plasmid replication protein RepC [Thioclava sp. SK-1]OCX60545.1 hypothetical protein BFP70_17400 [Thioclava sp. SK-1]
MTVQTTRFHGQPVTAAPEGPVLSYDKWSLVDDLTLAAADFGISHRTIAVLRAMLTFVPDRDLPALPGRCIVFASNDTLATRLGGMPESTLRRHLGALVHAGIVSRFDSPNRKRYAKRLGAGIACAFGFDLAPLARQAEQIQAAARQAQHRAQEHALLRSQIQVARQSLFAHLIAANIDPDGPHSLTPLLSRARLLLRRKDNAEELKLLLSEFSETLNTFEMNVNDIENERHQHKEININSDKANPAIQTPTDSVTQSVAQFDEYHRMFPQGATSWAELSQQAQTLVPMMGIDPPVYDEAKRHMGPQIAPIAILCLLERFDTIKNPGGYLRHLTQQARSSSMNIQALMRQVNIVS